MLAALPGHRSRRHIRLFLAILGLIALARPADASICHVAERPTFGMDFPREAWPSTIPDPELTAPAPLQFDQSPCPLESAGLPSKVESFRPAASIPPPFDPMLLVDPRWFEMIDPRSPSAESNPLERPPRDPWTFTSY